jgi:hypothetical protein
MIKIVDNSIQIIDKMLDAIVKGKSSDERKQILEQDVKNITFKKIDRTYLKELSDEIKNLEKSKKLEKDARKNAKTQALLEQLKNIVNEGKTKVEGYTTINSKIKCYENMCVTITKILNKVKL